MLKIVDGSTELLVIHENILEVQKVPLGGVMIKTPTFEIEVKTANPDAIVGKLQLMKNAQSLELDLKTTNVRVVAKV